MHTRVCTTRLLVHYGTHQEAEAVADKIDNTQVASPTLIIPAGGLRDRLLVQKCKLLAVSGPLKGREFMVARDSFTIGTGRHNDLVLDDSTISRRHCEIQLEESGYSIRDLGSTNGTIVQGVRVREAFLDEGTEFQLGSTRLVFCPTHETLEYKLSDSDHFGAMLGASVPMRRVFYLATRYAPTDSTVLIEGETGTGKEVLAEAIHRHSPRANKPFVVIDCATLGSDLIASELFGHDKGAFTGAIADRAGAFEFAAGGTIFLDEIGDLPAELQPKLLRVLERREIKRVGSNTVRRIDVRIIAATNKKLENEVNVGTFREDLFFRLSVVRMQIPPLRKRPDDIGSLLGKFMTDFLGADAMDQCCDFERAVRAFRGHNWPGNVRELRNLAELAAHSEHRPIELTAFLFRGNAREPRWEAMPRFAADRPFKVVKNELIREFEARYLEDLMTRHAGNVSQAARQAGIERAYLQRLVRKHGLKEGDIRKRR